jgi:hypothetical protein
MKVQCISNKCGFYDLKIGQWYEDLSPEDDTYVSILDEELIKGVKHKGGYYLRYERKLFRTMAERRDWRLNKLLSYGL